MYTERFVDTAGDLFIKFPLINNLKNQRGWAATKEANERYAATAIGKPLTLMFNKEESLFSDYHPFSPDAPIDDREAHVNFAEKYAYGRVVDVTKDSGSYKAGSDEIPWFATAHITDPTMAEEWRKPNTRLIPPAFSPGIAQLQGPDDAITQYEILHVASVPSGAFGPKFVALGKCEGDIETCTPKLKAAMSLEYSNRHLLNVSEGNLTRDPTVYSPVLWHATLDDKTCQVCERLDGSVFDSIDANSHFPAHDYCRCELKEELTEADIEGASYVSPKIKKRNAALKLQAARKYTVPQLRTQAYVHYFNNKAEPQGLAHVLQTGRTEPSEEKAMADATHQGFGEFREEARRVILNDAYKSKPAHEYPDVKNVAEAHGEKIAEQFPLYAKEGSEGKDDKGDGGGAGGEGSGGGGEGECCIHNEHGGGGCGPCKGGSLKAASTILDYKERCGICPKDAFSSLLIKSGSSDDSMSFNSNAQSTPGPMSFGQATVSDPSGQTLATQNVAPTKAKPTIYIKKLRFSGQQQQSTEPQKPNGEEGGGEGGDTGNSIVNPNANMMTDPNADRAFRSSIYYQKMKNMEKQLNEQKAQWDYKEKRYQLEKIIKPSLFVDGNNKFQQKAWENEIETAIKENVSIEWLKKYYTNMEMLKQVPEIKTKRASAPEWNNPLGSLQSASSLEADEERIKAEKALRLNGGY